MRTCLSLTVAVVVSSFLSILLLVDSASAGTTDRVSVSSAGEQGNSYSWDPAISPDGRFVAFCSIATNLVAGRTNGFLQVFVRDRQTGATELVSVSSAGEQGDDDSGGWGCVISADGRFVAFGSIADNLVLGDTNGAYDVFVHDRQTGATERVSVSSAGEQGDSDSGGHGCAISADGRFVAFDSTADNLVPGDTNGCKDIFVHDRQTGATERVSVSSTGEQANADYETWMSHVVAISPDCRFVAFSSGASNLVPADTNDAYDVFVHDRQTGATERVSISSAGEEGNWDSGASYCGPAISADGRFVAFGSHASNLAPGDTNGYSDIFVHDRTTGATERVSVSSTGEQGDDWSGDSGIAISADGRFVVFASFAHNLVPGDTNNNDDVFLHDRTTGVTEMVSLNTDGEHGDSWSDRAAITADNRYVFFESFASNLVPGDTNNTCDVFVRDWARPGFSDVPMSCWAYDEIAACAVAAVVSGYDDGTYHPGDPVTRDQMAVYIARALAGGQDNVPAGPATATFNDVPTSYWAYDDVEYCYDQKVVQGYTSTTYGPTNHVTRDQMAVYVARALVAPTGEAALEDYVPIDPRNFPDVDSEFWAYKHIEFCVEHGVVQGYDDGSYHPDYVVTRDQMAVYVARAFNLP
jgi:Tol biopolymer transport system component